MNLSVRNLSKFYGKQKALDNISFDLQDGELLGFLGPNGAGKTTTLRILSCYMNPTSGDVLHNGQSIFEDPLQYKKKIGYLPEHNPLYEDMFVVDFLDYTGRIQGMNAAETRKRVWEMIDYCGLDKEKHKQIGELSKGYRQRVGIAQAMIHDPELLILDEPTSGLDPNQIVEIREFIKKLGKEKAILLSSHVLSEVEASCDRVVIINNGQIVADDKSKNLKSKVSKVFIYLELEGDFTLDEVQKQLTNLEGVENVKQGENAQFIIQATKSEDIRKKIFEICNQQNWPVLELYKKESSLEDIFREVTR